MAAHDLDRRVRLLTALHALTVAAQDVFEALGETPESFLEMCLMDDVARALRAAQRVAQND